MHNRFVIPLLCALLGGCASMLSSVTSDLVDNLGTAIADQSDPEIVRDGAPSYLLMIDGLIAGEPDNARLLTSGARLYDAYAGAFVADDEARARILSRKALEYARRAACLELARLCLASDGKLDEFRLALDAAGAGDVELLYVLGSAWAGWIQFNSGDWNAVADLPKVTAVFERVAALDETWDNGGAHVYLGVIKSLLPAALGGRPDLARAHFERAIELSGGRNLMAKVLMARHYARAVFDKALHDSLLAEVAAADAEFGGYTLANTLAKREAAALLAESDDYF